MVLRTFTFIESAVFVLGHVGHGAGLLSDEGTAACHFLCRDFSISNVLPNSHFLCKIIENSSRFLDFGNNPQKHLKHAKSTRGPDKSRDFGQNSISKNSEHFLCSKITFAQFPKNTTLSRLAETFCVFGGKDREMLVSLGPV